MVISEDGCLDLAVVYERNKVSAFTAILPGNVRDHVPHTGLYGKAREQAVAKYCHLRQSSIVLLPAAFPDHPRLNGIPHVDTGFHLVANGLCFGHLWQAKRRSEWRAPL